MIFFSGSFQRALVNWKDGAGIALDFEGEDVGYLFDSLKRGWLIKVKGSFNFLVRHTTLISTHVLAVVNREDELFTFAMPIANLDGLWTYSNQFSDWGTHSYRASDGPMCSLTHPDIPSTQSESPRESGSFSPDDGIWILSTHIFKPSWKPDAPMEMFIIGYSLAWAKLKRLISYRVQLSFSHFLQPESKPAPIIPSFPDVQMTLVDASCAYAPSLPWDKHCVFNSGHVICLRKPMRCFALFTSEMQPLCELEIENHPWEWNSMHSVVTSVDPWSGKVLAATKGCLLVYRIE